MSRTGTARLEAIPAAIAQGDEFRALIKSAAGDTIRLADLMASAIAMHRAARGLETVGKDGRVTVSMEALQACYCMDDARKAYVEVRGSNRQPAIPQPSSAAATGAQP